MANQHESISHKFDLSLNLQVEVKHLSDYYGFSEERIKGILEDVELQMKEFVLSKICNEYYQEDVTETCDFVSFEIKPLNTAIRTVNIVEILEERLKELKFQLKIPYMSEGSYFSTNAKIVELEELLNRLNS